MTGSELRRRLKALNDGQTGRDATWASMYRTRFPGHTFVLSPPGTAHTPRAVDRRVIPKLLETPGLVVPLHEVGHGGAERPRGSERFGRVACSSSVRFVHRSATPFVSGSSTKPSWGGSLANEPVCLRKVV